jgi:hypothetical protein
MFPHLFRISDLEYLVPLIIAISKAFLYPKLRI